MAPSALRRFGDPYDASRPLELVVKPVTVMLSATVSPCTLSIRSERGLPRTVNGTGHTGPSRFCATSS